MAFGKPANRPEPLQALAAGAVINCGVWIVTSTEKVPITSELTETTSLKGINIEIIETIIANKKVNTARFKSGPLSRFSLGSFGKTSAGSSSSSIADEFVLPGLPAFFCTFAAARSSFFDGVELVTSEIGVSEERSLASSSTDSLRLRVLTGLTAFSLLFLAISPPKY